MGCIVRLYFRGGRMSLRMRSVSSKYNKNARVRRYNSVVLCEGEARMYGQAASEGTTGPFMRGRSPHVMSEGTTKKNTYASKKFTYVHFFVQEFRGLGVRSPLCGCSVPEKVYNEVIYSEQRERSTAQRSTN